MVKIHKYGYFKFILLMSFSKVCRVTMIVFGKELKHSKMKLSEWA